jgi:hypothetical protein
MNDDRYYDPFTGRRIAYYPSPVHVRSMREIKADFNRHIQTHAKSKTRPH